MDNNSEIYRNYQIYKSPSTGKYGIRDTNIDITIIKCVFDNIRWYSNSGLVKFTMQDLQAIYNIEDILTLENK